MQAFTNLSPSGDGTSTTDETGSWDLSQYSAERRALNLVAHSSDEAATFTLKIGHDPNRMIAVGGGSTAGSVNFTDDAGPYPYCTVEWAGNTGGGTVALDGWFRP